MMENQQKVTIKINDNGSIRVTGDVELLDGEGKPFESKAAVSLCRCGASGKKPFCDGTHKSIGFESQIRNESSE